MDQEFLEQLFLLPGKTLKPLTADAVGDDKQEIGKVVHDGGEPVLENGVQRGQNLDPGIFENKGHLLALKRGRDPATLHPILAAPSWAMRYRDRAWKDPMAQGMGGSDGEGFTWGP